MLQESGFAELDARLLLECLLNVNHSYLIAHDTDRLSNEQVRAYFSLVARAERQEPIPYIVGSIPFRFIELNVTPAVLIPRQETELLIDHALQFANGRKGLRAVDVGTGSGCIAISLAKELQAQVTAIDISAEALTIARQNAEHNDATIAFLHGSLLEPLSHPVDLIVANLPYVTDAEYMELEPGVREFEPKLALVGGEDGLDLVRELLVQAKEKLAPGGMILLEIGRTQAPQTCTLASNIFPEATISNYRDYADNERIVKVLTI